MYSSQPEDERTGQAKPRGRAALWLVLSCLVLAACAACLVVATATGIIVVNRLGRSGVQQLASAGEQATPAAPPRLTPAPLTSAAATPTQALPQVDSADSTVIAPSDTVTPAMAAPDVMVPSVIQQSPPPEAVFSHLSAILETEYPPRDYYETASRLGHSEVGRRLVNAQPVQVGDRQVFVTDDGQHEAVLLAITDHAYFWVETSLGYDADEIAEAGQRFEDEYYPAVAKLYGTDWQNGIDDDPRFSILHLDGYSDDSELGFFNSGDQYPRSVNSSSNEQEIVYLNMENLRPDEALYFGTVVHELQHLIQWHGDPNEPVWLSEGLAQFTELYTGLETVDTPPDYLDNPDTALNTWPPDAGDEIFAHYGAAYLFVVYFWEQLGDAAIQRLMQHPADGLAGISAVLDETGSGVPLDQFVLDWATANYLDDGDYGQRYEYDSVDLDSPKHALEIDQAPYQSLQTLDQFGVAYALLDVQGPKTVSFAGDTVAELLPAAPRSGDTMWFAPALNELDAQLTASFDLTGLTSAHLSFWAWYDLEEGYDFAYVSVSADGGTTWDLLMPEHAEAGEYGPGLSGSSGEVAPNLSGWVEETISLAPYTGGQVLIRFEVVSDSAVAEVGLALDDISVPELGYLDDVEAESAGWRASGFIRTGQFLPQIWRVNLIQHGPIPRVANLVLNERNQGKWAVDMGQEGGVLVITAQTPFVSKPANYWLAIDP
ncbi:MAG: immune inhibitor A [Chloroflexota bacterium]|nr:MAG: immune inhibitor A [Chloroflexota bacterium]